MYVQGIISNLGGWEKLQRNYPKELAEIQASIAGLADVVEYQGQKKQHLPAFTLQGVSPQHHSV